MIVDERIITFINSLDTKNSEILEDIEREALADNVPIIRREMQSFLKVLLMVKKPMRVLEVGTAVGFSALLMSEYVPEENTDRKTKFCPCRKREENHFAGRRCDGCAENIGRTV